MLDEAPFGAVTSWVMGSGVSAGPTRVSLSPGDEPTLQKKGEKGFPRGSEPPWWGHWHLVPGVGWGGDPSLRADVGDRDTLVGWGHLGHMGTWDTWADWGHLGHLSGMGRDRVTWVGWGFSCAMGTPKGDRDTLVGWGHLKSMGQGGDNSRRIGGPRWDGVSCGRWRHPDGREDGETSAAAPWGK